MLAHVCRRGVQPQRRPRVLDAVLGITRRSNPFQQASNVIETRQQSHAFLSPLYRLGLPRQHRSKTPMRIRMLSVSFVPLLHRPAEMPPFHRLCPEKRPGKNLQLPARTSCDVDFRHLCWHGSLAVPPLLSDRVLRMNRKSHAHRHRALACRSLIGQLVRPDCVSFRNHG
jgi:hypothetical protein